MTPAHDIPGAFRELEAPIGDLLNAAVIAWSMMGATFGEYNRQENGRDIYAVSPELVDLARTLHSKYHADTALLGRSVAAA